MKVVLTSFSLQYAKRNFTFSYTSQLIQIPCNVTTNSLLITKNVRNAKKHTEQTNVQLNESNNLKLKSSTINMGPCFCSPHPDNRLCCHDHRHRASASHGVPAYAAAFTVLIVPRRKGMPKCYHQQPAAQQCTVTDVFVFCYSNQHGLSGWCDKLPSTCQVSFSPWYMGVA